MNGLEVRVTLELADETLQRMAEILRAQPVPGGRADRAPVGKPITRRSKTSSKRRQPGSRTKASVEGQFSKWWEVTGHDMDKTLLLKRISKRFPGEDPQQLLKLLYRWERAVLKASGIVRKVPLRELARKSDLGMAVFAEAHGCARSHATKILKEARNERGHE